jgi:hypothetical protein
MILSLKRINMKIAGEYNVLEPILKNKFLTIASGATSIGSTGRTPDDVYS